MNDACPFPVRGPEPSLEARATIDDESKKAYVIVAGVPGECFGTPNIAAVNMGPRYSNMGAADALIVIEGGNLTPRSGLRTLAETEACLAALPCYMDNEAALEGLVEITATRVSVVTDMAIRAEEIDEAKAEAARERARARLREKIEDEEVASVNASLVRALAQLQVKRRQRR